MSDRTWDDEALSAHLDGEAAAGEWGPEVEARLAELRRAAAAVAAPVPPVDAATRDAMVSRALDAWAGDELAARRRRAGQWRVLAPVAAAVLALAVAVPLLASRDDDRAATTAAAPTVPQESEAALSADAAAPPVVAGDLGELAAPEDLVERVRPFLGARTAQRFAADGGGGAEGAPAPPEPVAGGAGSAGAVADSTGPPACMADVVRSKAGEQLVLVATVRWQGAPAVVLGVAGPDGAVRLEVRAAEGCSLLAAASVGPEDPR